METNMGHILVPQKLCEVVCYSVGTSRCSVRLCDYKVVIIIRLSGQFRELLLLLLQLPLLDKKRQRDFSDWQHTILRFCGCHFRNRGRTGWNFERQLLNDRKTLIFQINITPSQTENFIAP